MAEPVYFVIEPRRVLLLMILVGLALIGLLLVPVIFPSTSQSRVMQ